MTSEGFFEIVRRAGWGNGMTNDVNVEMPHSHYAELSDDEIVEVVLSEHKPSSNPIVRIVWTSCGLIFVVFAAIGLILRKSIVFTKNFSICNLCKYCRIEAVFLDLHSFG